VTAAELQAMFAALGAGPCRARVVGPQAYGFVEYEARIDAAAALAAVRAAPLAVDGQPLRVNWAQGSLPEWKRGPAVYRPRLGGAAAGGGAGGGAAAGGDEEGALPSPAAREARLAAQAIAEQLAAAAAATAGGLGGLLAAAAAQPAPRFVLEYDDL